MEIWSHAGMQYQVTSGYRVPAEAWEYELTGLTGPPGAGPYLAVDIPDATPDGPFTPKPARHVLVHAGGGVLPWRILEKLLVLLDASGDLIEDQRNLADDVTALPLTRNAWRHGNRRFEAGTFGLDDDGARHYELYEVNSGGDRNDHIGVRIPAASPDRGPFDQVTLTMRGQWTLPWPVFRRFVDAIHAGC